MWIRLINRLRIKCLLYYRYVDDCRSFLRAIKNGWQVTQNGLRWDSDIYKKDVQSGISPQRKTTNILVDLMNLILKNLVFTGEDCEMFASGELPTLDTSLYVEEGKIFYKFFEKETCGNQVLHASTAIDKSTIMSSMRQETVRRLSNTSLALPVSVKTDILKVFASKLLNSGYSKNETKCLIVEGVTKFEHLRWRDMLPRTHNRYHPLHMEATFNRHERKLKKFTAEANWYLPDDSRDQSWREKIPFIFRIKPTQTMRRGHLTPSSVMKVPSSKGGRLIRALMEKEPHITKVSGYTIKYVEQSGTPLHLLFRKSPKAKVCGRTDCMSCRFENKKQSMCSVKNIVYESVCTWCEKDENKVPGQEPYKYIGETSRTLYERMKEHWSDAGKIKDCSHIARHWATVHSESLRPPLFKFTVVKKHTRALSRQIHEAVRISSKGNLNDKLEWKINSIDRLGTKLNHREEEALRKEEINNKRERDNRMNDLKNRLNSSAPPLPSFTQPEMSHDIVGGYVVEGPTSHRNELKKRLRSCAPPLSSFTQIQMSKNTVGGNVVEGPTSHREAPVCGKKIARRHRTKESSDKSNKIHFNFRDP